MAKKGIPGIPHRAVSPRSSMTVNPTLQERCGGDSRKTVIDAKIWAVRVSTALLDITDAKCSRVSFPPCGPPRGGIMKASWKRNATTVTPDDISHSDVGQGEVSCQ